MNVNRVLGIDFPIDIIDKEGGGMLGSLNQNIFDYDEPIQADNSYWGAAYILTTTATQYKQIF